ncbi:MAG TPA: hypothetical protein VFQ06_15740 [Nitrospira sp.]|nr:hypothetical protein [Nitrospira sp.]
MLVWRDGSETPVVLTEYTKAGFLPRSLVKRRPLPEALRQALQHVGPQRPALRAPSELLPLVRIGRGVGFLQISSCSVPTTFYRIPREF